MGINGQISILNIFNGAKFICYVLIFCIICVYEFKRSRNVDLRAKKPPKFHKNLIISNRVFQISGFTKKPKAFCPFNEIGDRSETHQPTFPFSIWSINHHFFPKYKLESFRSIPYLMNFPSNFHITVFWEYDKDTSPLSFQLKFWININLFREQVTMRRIVSNMVLSQVLPFSR